MHYNTKDITGQVFGRLTIIGYAGASRWDCLCECGLSCTAHTGNLRKGVATQCTTCSRKKLDTVRLIDLTGQKINFWTVIEYVGKSKFRCQCDCGVISNVLARYLKNGKSKSCSSCHGEIGKFLQMGDKVGKLTLLTPSLRNNSKSKYWECQCECGTKEYIAQARLSRNQRTTCRKCNPNIPRVANAAFNKLYFSYRTGAISRHIEWGLTEEEFRTITSANCYYTGLPPSGISKTQISEYIFNGVDRVDNDRGYFIDNCVPCNGKINKMKNNMTYSEFVELCALVSKGIELKSKGLVIENKLKIVC